MINPRDAAHMEAATLPALFARAFDSFVERNYDLIAEDLGVELAQAEELLRQADEPTFDQYDAAENAFAVLLPGNLKETFREFTSTTYRYKAWRERVAYSLGLAVGRKLNGRRPSPGLEE